MHGRNPFRTTLKPWLTPLFVDVFVGESNQPWFVTGAAKWMTRNRPESRFGLLLVAPPLQQPDGGLPRKPVPNRKWHMGSGGNRWSLLLVCLLLFPRRPFSGWWPKRKPAGTWAATPTLGVERGDICNMCCFPLDKSIERVSHTLGAHTSVFSGKQVRQVSTNRNPAISDLDATFANPAISDLDETFAKARERVHSPR